MLENHDTISFAPVFSAVYFARPTYNVRYSPSADRALLRLENFIPDLILLKVEIHPVALQKLG